MKKELPQQLSTTSTKKVRTLSSFLLQIFTIGFVIITMNASAQQTLWLEEFDGGASASGFWVDSLNTTDCRWEFAPDSVSAFDFNQDFSGEWPAGTGFDSSFVFLDSDACGGTTVVVNSFLTSAPFDASALGTYWLHYSHQFQARLASFCRIEASPDGLTWSEVAYYTTDDVGYPNPSVRDSADLTVALGSSATAQVRFQFNSGWDWWWALDSISVEFTMGTVGLDENTTPAGMRIHPNPAQDLVMIGYDGSNARTVELRDMFGRLVLRKSFDGQLTLSSLPVGTYMVILLDEQERAIDRKRIVKR